MHTNLTGTKLVTAAVGAAITGLAAPALLFLGTGTAQATLDVKERGTITIGHLPQGNQSEMPALPTPGKCSNCVGFNPQPDPPGYPAPSTHQSRGPVIGHGDLGYGGPDTLPSLHP